MRVKVRKSVDSYPSMIEKDNELKAFDEYLRVRGARDTTIRTHIYRMKKVKRVLKKSLLSIKDKSELEIVRAWLNHGVNNRKKSNQWFNQYVSSIRKFYIPFWARMRGKGKVSLPPLLDIKADDLFANKPTTGKDTVMTFQHRDVFFKVLSTRRLLWQAFWTFLYDGGLRIQEGIYATKNNIDRELMVYHVRNPKYKNTPVDDFELKHSRHRNVEKERDPPISEHTLKIIDGWMKQRPETPKEHPQFEQLIFLDNIKTYKQFGKQEVKKDRYALPLYKVMCEREFKKIIDECKMYCEEKKLDLKWDGITPHVLRASSATHQHFAGTDAVTISKNFGHKNTDPIMGYIRISDEWKAKLNKDERIPAPMDIGKNKEHIPLD